jgi:hypothetical protein
VIQIALSDQHAALLREMFEAKLRDLRREESHTDSPRFRQTLYQLEDMIQSVLGQLGGVVTAGK